MRKSLVGLTLAAILASSACGDNASTSSSAQVDGVLAGSGSTFAKAMYETSITDFQKHNPNARITYAGGGSGKGRTDLQSQVVDYAGTDGLIKDADKPNYKGGDVLYFPTVVAPITVSYNLDVDLKLSGPTLAKIFQRQIKTWDDLLSQPRTLV